LVPKKHSGTWGVFTHPSQLLYEAAQFLKEFLKANAREAQALTHTGTHAPEIWKTPPDGMYKINWDVAIDSKNRRMGIGIIARDFEG
jgi:hypothetical protein